MKRFILLLAAMMLVLATTTTGFALDKVKEAEKLYQQALKIEKTKPKDAIKLLDKAISYNPKNPEYYFKRGWLEPNYGKVILDYNKAVVLNPVKYFEKCYGAIFDGERYVLQLNGMSVKADTWLTGDSEREKIVKYLSTYKGDRLKNVQDIMSKATGDAITMLTLSSPTEEEYLQFTMYPDLNNETADNSQPAEELSSSLSEDEVFFDITEVKTTKLGNVSCAYFDYKQSRGDVNLYCRTYTFAFNYYVVLIHVVADNETNFNHVINDVLGTFEMK